MISVEDCRVPHYYSHRFSHSDRLGEDAFVICRPANTVTDCTPRYIVRGDTLESGPHTSSGFYHNRSAYVRSSSRTDLQGTVSVCAVENVHDRPCPAQLFSVSDHRQRWAGARLSVPSADAVDAGPVT